MNMEKYEDVRNTAIKLDEIKAVSPEDYFYIKGYIHCLLQKEIVEKRKQKELCRTE